MKIAKMKSENCSKYIKGRPSSIANNINVIFMGYGH
jgi:hypothetical protein